MGKSGYAFLLLLVLQKPFLKPYFFRVLTFVFATVALWPLNHIRASFVAGVNEPQWHAPSVAPAASSALTA